MFFRSCQDSKDIREASDELNADPKIQDIPSRLQSSLSTIGTTITSIDNQVTKIQKDGDCFLKNLDDYTKTLVSEIKALREKARHAIKRKQEELLTDLNNISQLCIVLKDDIERSLDTIDKSTKWQANVFVLKKKSSVLPQKVEALFNESVCILKRQQFNFVNDMNIFDSLKGYHSLVEEGSTRLDNMKTQGAESSNRDRSLRTLAGRGEGETVRNPAAQRPSVRTTPYKSTREMDINIRVQTDQTDCSINACCRLSNESLLLADGQNKKLKLVEPSRGNAVKVVETEQPPRAICLIGPHEVAVSIHLCNKQYHTVLIQIRRCNIV